MVEFNFHLKDIFKNEINKITSNDLKAGSDQLVITNRIGEVINALGVLSAYAQNLKLPITSLEKLQKTSDQTIYILVDLNTGKGRAIGFLKIGFKDLYLFDSSGHRHFEEKTSVILDFFIHNSFQRRGCGKKLFDHMLKEEHLDIKKVCVDKPSTKMLSFLNKNYNLVETIEQGNNFVLYRGFFGKEPEPENKNRRREKEVNFFKI